jgi:hypothetical protein
MLAVSHQPCSRSRVTCRACQAILAADMLSYAQAFLFGPIIRQCRDCQLPMTWKMLIIMSMILNMQETWSSIISIIIAFRGAQPYYGVRLAYRGAHRDAVCRFRSWLVGFLIVPWIDGNNLCDKTPGYEPKYYTHAA